MSKGPEFLQLTRVNVCLSSHSGVFQTKKSPAKQGFLEEAKAGLVRADNFDINATIRLQAVDELLALRALALILGDRLLFAFAFGVNAVGFNAFADEEGLDSSSALLGERLIVGVGAKTVSMTDCNDHFQLHALQVGDQFGQFLLAFRAQSCLVESAESVTFLAAGLTPGAAAAAAGAAMSFLTKSGSHSAMAIAGVQ